jgi:hypothetical protein
MKGREGGGEGGREGGKKEMIQQLTVHAIGISKR